MKHALLIIGILIILMIGGYTLYRPDTAGIGDVTKERVDLPWNVIVLNDGSSRIFDIHLGTTTLNEAVEMWGRPANMALFASKGEPLSVEVFFKNPPTGPMKASVVLTLQTTQQEMLNIGMNATGQSGTETGDSRLLISEQDQEKLLHRNITNLTYLPSYSGLDAEYFEERLGKATATHRESDTATSWFYPEIGLTLLIDNQGKDVFQYESPIDFQLPNEALPNALAPKTQ